MAHQEESYQKNNWNKIAKIMKIILSEMKKMKIFIFLIIIFGAGLVFGDDAIIETKE